MTEEAHSSTHPPLPPTTEDSWFSRLRLLRSRRVGPVRFHRLLAEHGSAQNALEALPKMARTAGMSGYEICSLKVISPEKSAPWGKSIISVVCLGRAACEKLRNDK